MKIKTTKLEMALIFLEKAKLEQPKFGRSNLIRFYNDVLEDVQKKLVQYTKGSYETKN